MKRSALISICVFASLRLCVGAGLDTGKLADAIYRAEGGARAKVPYGIMSVKVRNAAEARAVCIRTIEHAWCDYAAAADTRPFIHFLADRYCPPSVDPIGNRNWKHNVALLCK